MTARRPLDRLAGLLSLGLLGVALHTFWSWCRIDRREPVDLGHYYASLPAAWEALSQGHLPLELAAEVGGLYNLYLAGLLSLVGRSQSVLEANEALSLAEILIAAWGVGAALGGRRGGLWALALAAAMPAFQVGARTHWIHHPEAAALGLAAWLWARDPQLLGRITRPAMTFLFAFAFTLRPTGLVFGLPLMGLAVYTGRRRAWVLAVSLLPAAIVLGPDAAQYVAGKIGVRSAYAGSVPPVWKTFHRETFIGPGLLAAVGAVLAMTRRLPASPQLVLLGMWLALGLTLSAGFHVGPDNFPLAPWALAVLGGVGLSAVLPSAADVGVVALAVACLRVPLSPPSLAERAAWLTSSDVASFEAHRFLRPQSHVPTVEGMAPLLERTCPSDCTLLSTTGLFSPNREDDAALALFIGGVDGVRLVNAGLWHPAEAETPRIDGLVVQDCGMAPPPPRDPFGEREQVHVRLAGELATELVGEIAGYGPCMLTFHRLPTEELRRELGDRWRDYPWRLQDNGLPGMAPPAASPDRPPIGPLPGQPGSR